MKRFIQLLTLISHFAFIGCEKNWLDAKRDLNTVIPNSLKDYRSILNSSSSPGMALNYTSLHLMSAEEFYVADATFNSGSEMDRNIYSWNPTIFPAGTTIVGDWDDSYRQVFNANVVLDGLSSVVRNTGNAAEWDDVKGGALFFRAKAFFGLAQVFAAPFYPEAVGNPNGIPLRLSSDPNPATMRASVGQTYDRIVQDLLAAIPLLNLPPKIQTDASKPAAYAMLARCLLSMRDYDRALAYADSALQLHSNLMDYNTLLANINDLNPMPMMNEETLLYSTYFAIPTYIFTNAHTVNPDLLARYQEHDLRLELFFNSTYSFRGSYTASLRLFNGLASDELYLIRAECQARAGMESKALDDLNYLLSHRFATDNFVPYTLQTAGDVVGLVLEERRKELLFRGLRWTDLRRLNQESEHAITLQRTINGQIFTLPPNSSRYTMPIPDYIIQQTGIPQNQRIQE